jgi:hypothetical protein
MSPGIVGYYKWGSEHWKQILKECNLRTAIDDERVSGGCYLIPTVEPVNLPRDLSPISGYEIRAYHRNDT